MAQELHEEPTLRTVQDIDLLVPREDTIRAVRLLRRPGYKLEADKALFKRAVLHSEHAITYGMPIAMGYTFRHIFEESYCF